ncbi:hypothetical protein M378DRAFT_6328 [Amanita muscaria Koide BX008]|uniref:Uncharacterized protein n=1 Tax=Amanita muscaria (strain Koide BX008) TaxID=946122 RepID=A0A0C2XQX6_AMAMK|nr:hypothetical protein M378DRAFT_6328 [Amanita muscaria Koide BX008]
MAQEATSKTRVGRRPRSSTNSRRSHSLAISPNLDALLEFEERHRGSPSPKASPAKVDSDLPSVSAPPTSLPPPPRGQKISKTWLTSKTEPNSPNMGTTGSNEIPVRLASSSESNPFINPAPKLEDLLSTKFTNDGSAIGVKEAIQVAALTRSSNCRESVSGPFSVRCSNEATGGSPVSQRSPPFDDPHLTTEGQPSLSKITALPWVLKAKSTTSHLVDQTTHNIDTEQRPPMIQSQAKERKTKRNSKFLDMNDDKPRRWAISNSHAKEIKTESIASSTTVDSMFNFLSLSTPTRGSPEADRHSFIDFLSPTLSDSGYNNPFDSSDHIRSTVGSSSSKSLLETAPRRILDDPTSYIYRQRRGEAVQSPSTHPLEPNERAGLIKKSRKLARMFGQTPEPGALLHTFSESHHTAAHISGRRHSLPLTIKTGGLEVPSSRSPTSFIDLSDDDDNISITTISTVGRRRRSIASPSLIESISQEEKVKEERRRKRERLVKLHRFLGSRVPPSLVLGPEDPNISLPPERPSTSPGTSNSQHKTWLRRRRSSSAAELPSTWSDEHDRMGAELCSREKAINVKRAQKMEKVFGVAPPQTLYHTRHIPAPPLPGIIMLKPYMARVERNPNRTAYTKHRSRKGARSRSTDSMEGLLTKDGNAWNHDTVESSPVSTRTKRSRIYTNYEHSLNSLHDILDKDDRASLAELHQYLTSDEHSPTSPLFQISPTRERRSSVTSSIKSDRRHSLPASMTSISPELSLTMSRPDLTDFQLRRRRAAKLTNFFGVDYRVLIQDVLESIESGLEHERKRGTLAAEEAEDLLQKLRQLTLKRPSIY